MTGALLQGGQPVAYCSRAMTPAETRYAQVEKELLAIVFAVEQIEPYVHSPDRVIVESDHKPLQFIFQKQLHAVPKRLECMLLRLEKCSLHVHYKKGKEKYLADTLSRAYLSEVNACDPIPELGEFNHRQYLAVSEERWQQINHASADFPVLQQLRVTIRHGCPESKSDLTETLYPYYGHRDTLTVQDDLVFKGQQLVVPTRLRKELMEVAHSSHIGIEGCLRRARECFLWPQISTELREYVAKCDICLSHRTAQQKEPLMQHEVVARPWSKIGADLCELNNRTLLVICDYYSNYIEVARFASVTSRSIIKEMKAVFTQF